jgi:hypothetical protein
VILRVLLSIDEVRVEKEGQRSYRDDGACPELVAKAAIHDWLQNDRLSFPRQLQTKDENVKGIHVPTLILGQQILLRS